MLYILRMNACIPHINNSRHTYTHTTDTKRAQDTLYNKEYYYQSENFGKCSLLKNSLKKRRFKNRRVWKFRIFV
jgi:hypothetical protein